MKRLLLVFAVLLFAAVAGAQSRYSVYKCTEGVSVRKFKSEEWVSVNKHDEVSLVDMFSVSEGGLLVVLDSKNRSLYKFGEVREKSLKLLIEEAVSKSDNVTAGLNKELMSKTEKAKEYTQVAAAYRGADASTGFVDSLAIFIKSSLASGSPQKLMCYGLSGKSDEFSMERVSVGDDEFCFAVSNNSDEDVFVNVVYVDNAGRCGLCYDFDYVSAAKYIFLPSGQKIQLTQYSFVSVSDDEFHLLVTSQPYDSHALQMAL